MYATFVDLQQEYSCKIKQNLIAFPFELIVFTLQRNLRDILRRETRYGH